MNVTAQTSKTRPAHDAHSKYWKPGETGKHVKDIEGELKRLGYSPGKVDGKYDQQTANAAKRFKADEARLRANKDIGGLSKSARDILRKEVRALDHKPKTVTRNKTKKTVAQDRLVDGAAKRGVKRGDHNQAVSVIQQHLRDAGFDPKNTSGAFDDRTEGMVKEFQRREKLSPTGVVNAHTWAELKKVTVENDGLGTRRTIMKRAHSIGDEINKTGGYRFDGVNDCYGFLRRVWDPVMAKHHMSGLPISDLGSAEAHRNWGKINDFSKLPVGTPLATAQGHEWGPDWHCGLFAGMHHGVPYIYDNSGSMNGAYVRPMPPGLFSYFYRPAAKLAS